MTSEEMKLRADLYEIKRSRNVEMQTAGRIMAYLFDRLDDLQAQVDAQGKVIGGMLTHPAPASGSVALSDVTAIINKHSKHIDDSPGVDAVVGAGRRHYAQGVLGDILADLGRLAPPAKASEHDVFEYDGAFQCLRCKATWGALPGLPTMPPLCIPPAKASEPPAADDELRKRAEEVVETWYHDVSICIPSRERSNLVDLLLAFARSATGSKVVNGVDPAKLREIADYLTNLSPRQMDPEYIAFAVKSIHRAIAESAEFSRLNPQAAGDGNQ